MYPIIATYLLTGGREKEVLGLEVEDISFDRGTVTFRPNRWRRLKTATGHRTVPLWPQLEEVLRDYIYGGASTRVVLPASSIVTLYSGPDLTTPTSTSDVGVAIRYVVGPSWYTCRAYGWPRYRNSIRRPISGGEPGRPRAMSA